MFRSTVALMNTFPDSSMSTTNRLPLDSSLAEIVAVAASQPPLYSVPLQAAREAISTRIASSMASAAVARVENLLMPGPGGSLPLRVYWPTAGGRRHPATLYLHGGGFVVMDLATHDGICRQLCSQSGSVIVSVDYRLAPEVPFPGATDDALAALRWVATHADELGIDNDSLAVAGDSAGGNLAAVTAVRVRDEGGPSLKAQLLFYPVVDASEATDWPSRKEFASGYGMTAELLDWFMAQYLPDAQLRCHPHASPILANLKGLPPTRIVVAGYDVLRDEAEAYSARLESAGVPVSLVRHDDLNHAFLHWSDRSAGARLAIQQSSAWLKNALA